MPGLAFNAATRILYGTPAAAATTALTYTVTDDNGSTAMDTFTVAVAASVSLNAPGDQTYRTDRPITALTLPIAYGGDGALTYTLRDASGNDVDTTDHAVPGLTFNEESRTLSGTPTEGGTTTMTYTARDTRGNAVSVSFDITVVGEMATFTALNKVILPEVTRAMADSSTSSIARRVEQAATGTETATLTLNGRTLSLTTLARAGSLADALDSPGVAETLTATARGLADGSWQPAQLFGNSSFVLPLNAGGGMVNRLMLWGRGDYRNVSGKSGGMDWDGTLISGQLGADAQITDAFLAGLAISRQSGTFNYTSADTMRGAYDLEQTSIHPYLGWAASDGRMDAWVTLGYGLGAVEIDDEDADGSQTADLTTRTIGGGGSAMVLDSYTGTLRLKGELLQTQADVDGNAAGITELNVDASRIRLTLEGTRNCALANGAFLRQTVEVGLRHDAGDGKTGTGAEIGGSLRFTHPAQRLTLEGQWRVLVAHSGDYGDWGISGMLQFKPGTDGQGVSMSVTPGYGASASGIQQLWRQGLPVNENATTAAAAAIKLDARVGYGVALRTREGMLTPYGELTLGATNSYRLGMIWKTGTQFDLTLTGERRENTGDPTEHSLLLKGETRF